MNLNPSMRGNLIVHFTQMTKTNLVAFQPHFASWWKIF